MTLLQDRAKHSKERIEQLRKAIGAIDVLQKDAPQLCIYLTGSFGRQEASSHSDLDVFFVARGSGTKKSDLVPRLTKILLDAQLIRIAGEMGFPRFSGDGRWLQIHYLEDIKSDLGSPADDFNNYFTARMLLLLESVPIFGDDLYSTVVKEIIDAYYRDYHDHSDEFKPIFLANDVMRFWKTMCLNYEYKRNRLPPDGDAKLKNESHLQNFKLKFSRLLTCFSTIVVLARNGAVLKPAALADCVQQPPFERMRRAVQGIAGADTLLATLEADYSWFLEATGKPKDDQLAWISDRSRRTDAFERARKFGDDVHKLVTTISPPTIQRYLMV